MLNLVFICVVVVWSAFERWKEKMVELTNENSDGENRLGAAKNKISSCTIYGTQAKKAEL